MRRFKNVIGRHLPLLGVSDLVTVRAALIAKCPHGHRVVDVLLAELDGRDHIHAADIVAGRPGLQKGSSRLARW
jgi:hypothetical protein